MNENFQNSMNVKKISMAGMLCAMAVVGSTISIPVLGSRCAPVQHIVNMICGVVLGPYYSVMVAFIASLIRNVLGLGSILAFPGSMFGALLCGLMYKKSRNIYMALAGEVFGTAILGGLTAYPLSILFLGQVATDVAFYIYITPFLISTSVGAILSLVIIIPLKNVGIISKLNTR